MSGDEIKVTRDVKPIVCPTCKHAAHERGRCRVMGCNNCDDGEVGEATKRLEAEVAKHVDADVNGMDKFQLKMEVMKLRGAVREHRDQKGHDRCWLDDVALYGVLPEPPPADVNGELPPEDDFIAGCRSYWRTRKSGVAHDQCSLATVTAERDTLKAQKEELELELVSQRNVVKAFNEEWIGPVTEIRKKLEETCEDLGVKDFDDMTEKFCEHRDARKHLQKRIEDTEKFMIEFPGLWESAPVGGHRTLEGAAGDICAGLVFWKGARQSDLEEMFRYQRDRDAAMQDAVLARQSEKLICEKLAAAQKEIDEFQMSFDLYHKASMALMHAYKKAHPEVDENTWPNARTVNVWAVEQIQKLDEIAFNCPSCGRHDFGMFAGEIKEACGPCKKRAEEAERKLAEAMNVIDDIPRRPWPYTSEALQKEWETSKRRARENLVLRKKIDGLRPTLAKTVKVLEHANERCGCSNPDGCRRCDEYRVAIQQIETFMAGVP